MGLDASYVCHLHCSAHRSPCTVILCLCVGGAESRSNPAHTKLHQSTADRGRCNRQLQLSVRYNYAKAVMIASVLLQNQDLIASFSPAHDKSSSSLAEHGSHTQNRRSVKQAVESAAGHRHNDQASHGHGERYGSNNHSTMLIGSIEGPEVFEQRDNDDGQGTNANVTCSSDGAAEPEEDVGCNSVINFFLAEMLGGSAV